MFISVGCNVIKFPYSLLRGSDLTHIPEVQWPMLIMKNKLTHMLRSLPAGSIPMRKGTTLLSNKGYFHPCGFQIWGPPRCMPKGNRLWAVCISLHSLRDWGELHSSTKRDSSFPHSTPGVVPSIPMHIPELISLNQPGYGQVGDYE